MNQNAETKHAGGTEQAREEEKVEDTSIAKPTPALETPAEQPRRRRGFAAMDQDRVKAIASKGGKAAHAAGTAHQFNSDEARTAGRKGGMAPHVRRGGVRRRPNEGSSPSNPTVGENTRENR